MAVLDAEQDRFACGGTAVVELSGELDIATAEGAFTQLVAAVADDCVIVDLCAVEFIDASGVNALVGAMRAATRAQRHFILAAPPRQLERILDVLSLREVLHTERDVLSARVSHDRAARATRLR